MSESTKKTPATAGPKNKPWRLLIAHDGRLFNPLQVEGDFILASEVTGVKGKGRPHIIPRKDVKVVAWDGVKETPILG